MKIGDKARGFRFESDLLSYSCEMDPYVGVEGEIFKIMEDRFIGKRIPMPQRSRGATCRFVK